MVPHCRVGIMIVRVPVSEVNCSVEISGLTIATSSAKIRNLRAK